MSQKENLFIFLLWSDILHYYPLNNWEWCLTGISLRPYCRVNMVMPRFGIFPLCPNGLGCWVVYHMAYQLIKWKIYSSRSCQFDMHLYQFLHHLKPTVNYAVSELHQCITYFAKKHINFIFRKNDSESLKKVFL